MPGDTAAARLAGDPSGRGCPPCPVCGHAAPVVSGSAASDGARVERIHCPRCGLSFLNIVPPLAVRNTELGALSS